MGQLDGLVLVLVLVLLEILELVLRGLCRAGRDSKSGERGEHVRAIFFTLLC